MLMVYSGQNSVLHVQYTPSLLHFPSYNSLIFIIEKIPQNSSPSINNTKEADIIQDVSDD